MFSMLSSACRISSTSVCRVAPRLTRSQIDSRRYGVNTFHLYIPGVNLSHPDSETLANLKKLIKANPIEEQGKTAIKVQNFNPIQEASKETVNLGFPNPKYEVYTGC